MVLQSLCSRLSFNVCKTINTEQQSIRQRQFLHFLQICTSLHLILFFAIDHLKSGYLVEPGDVEDMAKGIEYTLFNDTSGMVKDAYDKVNKMFTIEVMWGGHYEVYKKLMSK